MMRRSHYGAESTDKVSFGTGCGAGVKFLKFSRVPTSRRNFEVPMPFPGTLENLRNLTPAPRRGHHAARTRADWLMD